MPGFGQKLNVTGMALCRWLSRMLAAVMACGALPAAAEPSEIDRPSASNLPAMPLTDLVEHLLRTGRTDEAAHVLEQVLKAQPDDQQAVFLTGIVAMAKADHKRAIKIFRAMLIDHPEAMRVRLELARAFFVAKDYANADRQFRFARAGNPPPDVIANIEAYLFAIRQAKNWSYSFGIAIAPDTNINAGASTREVTLFGLPFELTDDARRQSGTGVAVDGGVEWAPAIGTGTRIRMGLNGQRREYSGESFDDMTVAGYAGPRFVVKRWDVSVLGTAFRRWYGSQPIMRSHGGRIDATYYLNPEVGLSGSLSSQWIDYLRSPERNGPLYSASVGGIYALTPDSAVSIKTGVNRQTARLSAYSNWSGYAAIGYYRDLPAGFSAYVEPSIALARHDAALAVFGQKRSDTIYSAQVAVLNRHIVLSRFTPRLAYTFTRQISNIPLFDFTRNRIEIGLTTAF